MSGIGTEVLLKALATQRVQKALTPLVFGDASLARVLPQTQLRVVSRLPATQRRPGRPTRAGGKAQFAYLQNAIAAAKAGEIEAICTAPVSKEQIAKAGIPFQGHTEVLGEAWGVETVMLMDGPGLRVALATNHLPLREVPRALTQQSLRSKLNLLSKGLTKLLRKKPRIAVLGLNPHAGDGGLLGSEEQQVIVPVVSAAKRAGVNCAGPFPADGFFASAAAKKFDVVLAMFHDQGLIAAKMYDFRHTVNVTLGLPLVRTSPDHGVAYDIAGQNKADAEPMVQALLRAAEYA